jgi:hypothetical protein
MFNYRILLRLPRREPDLSTAHRRPLLTDRSDCTLTLEDMIRWSELPTIVLYKVNPGTGQFAIMKKSAILVLVFLSQVFAEDKSAVTFRSTCFSNVCIGDDIDKIIQAQPHWATAHLKSSDEGKGVIHLRDLADQRKKYAAIIGRAYHDLSAADLETLAGNFLDRGYAGEPAPYSRLMDSLVRDKASFLVADSTVLPILQKATLCGLLPVHGVFVSESGLYTGALLLPVNGKYTVVQM